MGFDSGATQEGVTHVVDLLDYPAVTDARYAQALTRTAVKTGNYTAASGELVPVDTSSSAVTITLPTAPGDKARVAVKAIAPNPLVNAVTVACGGSDVINKAGGSTSLTITTANQGWWLQYDSATGIWTAQDSLALSSLDVRYAKNATALVPVGAELGSPAFAAAANYAVCGAVALIGCWEMVLIPVSTPATFDRVSALVNVAVANSVVRLGVYEWPGTLPPYPTPTGVWTRVVDAGTIDCSTTGVKSATFTAFTKAATVLAVVLVNQPAVAAGSAQFATAYGYTGIAASPFGVQTPGGTPNMSIRVGANGQGPLITGALPATIDLGSGLGPQWMSLSINATLRRSA